MLSKRKISDKVVGGLLLLLFLLSLHIVHSIFSLSEPDRNPCWERVFVQISGDIPFPGVYGFHQSPCLNDLMIRAGCPPGVTSQVEGSNFKTEKGLTSKGFFHRSGANVNVRNDGNVDHVSEGEMSAFYKLTLGIPISLNEETLEGLTAIPGIGPKLAGAIVCERSKREGFQRLDEILSVRGIGPALFNKISPYLVL